MQRQLILLPLHTAPKEGEMKAKQRRQKSIKVHLTPEERAALRRNRLTLLQLHTMDPVKLSVTSGMAIERAEYLVAMVQFQSLGSVGPASAQDFWNLGCRSLVELARCDPVDLYEHLRQQSGGSLDPCVEDTIRCAIAQARFPEMPEEYKNWWYWKPQRGRHHISMSRKK
jgi:hypothetical protein